jgi:arylsulfatase A-like enzyme
MQELYGDLPEQKQHYYSVITALDAQVGRLRAKLRELGIERKTMLFFTSDNGPEGNPGPAGRSQGTAGTFRGRKRSLYEGGIRVPGLLEWPDRVKEHLQIDIPVVTSDYFPTICEILGYTLKDDRPMDGISLLEILNGKQQQRGKAIGFQFDGHQQKALIGDRFKLVQNTGEARPRSDNGEAPYMEFELYDLAYDPGESWNVAEQYPDIFRKMKADLEAFVESCDRSERGEDYQP